MIYLQITLLILACLYVYFAYKVKTKDTGPVFDPRLKTWRRDMTAHEVKLYNEMRRHWAKQAKATYKKINEYDKRKNATR
jgi:hypothetical protein